MRKSLDFLAAFLFLRYIYTKPPANAKTTTGITTPIAACAPVLNPLDAGVDDEVEDCVVEDVGEEVGDVVGNEVDEVVVVELDPWIRNPGLENPE